MRAKKDKPVVGSGQGAQATGGTAFFTGHSG